MTAQELKNSILQLAIQGKLVKQDSNDEPASVLLEKIKEERKKLIKEKKIKKEKYSEIYKEPSDNHYYEKFEDGTVNDITEEIPFDIPDSWKWERFDNIFNIVNGFTPLKSNIDFWNSNDINWFTIEDYNEQGFEINYTKQFITDKALGKNSNRILPKDTVIICCTASIGTVAITNIPLTTNQQFNGLVKKTYFSDFYISKFIYYYCLTLKKTMLDKAGKTTFPFLSVKKLGEFLIPFPPLNEQKKIIAKIELFNQYIESYNSCYTKLENLNNNYKEELKKSILQYAIQGKLVKQDPNDEPADVLINKILDEKRELIKSKQIKKENLSVIYKDSTDNQFYEKFDDGTIKNITDEIPFDIPDNWAWTRMKNICLINPKNSLDDNLETSFIPMTLIDAGYSNSHTYEIKKWKEIKSGFTHFKENDIGLAKITPCFQNRKSTIFSNLKNGFGAGTTELHILRPINDLIYTKFIFWLIKSPYFIDNGVKTYSGTAGQQRINKDFLPNFLVPIPNYKTQVCIINKIETIFNLI